MLIFFNEIVYITDVQIYTHNSKTFITILFFNQFRKITLSCTVTLVVPLKNVTLMQIMSSTVSKY